MNKPNPVYYVLLGLYLDTGMWIDTENKSMENIANELDEFKDLFRKDVFGVFSTAQLAMSCAAKLTQKQLRWQHDRMNDDPVFDEFEWFDNRHKATPLPGARH